MIKVRYLGTKTMAEFTRIKLDYNDGDGYDENEINHLSFDSLLSLIDEADDTGATRGEKLHNIRNNLRDAWQHFDKRYIGEEEQLANNFSPEEKSPFIKNFYDIVQDAKGEDKDKLDLAELNKKELFRQANVLMMLDDASLSFFEDHKNDENFAQLWQTFIKNNSKETLTYNRLCCKNKNRLKAEVAYKLKDAHLQADYKNLNNSGLSVTILDGKLSIITKNNEAAPITEISQEQSQALIDFLQDSGQKISFDDETQKLLENIKVTYTAEDGTQKVGKYSNDKDIDLFSELREEGCIAEVEILGYGAELTDEQRLDANTASTEDQQVASPSNATTSSTPNSSLKDDGAEISSFGFVSTKSDPKEYKEIRKKFLNEFKRAHIDDVIDVRLGIGGFEIVSWGSEDDKRNDGKIDPKTGIKADKRGFGCKFKYGPPPSATLTSGNLKKMSKTDAAAVLKGLKAAGALYVAIPAKEILGAEAFKNTLMATISSGVVPRLGGGPKSSSGIGKGEAAEIWKTLKDADRKVSEKIDYALRFSEQLYIHEDYLRKSNKAPEFASYPAFFLAYARFGNFNETYFDNLIEFKGVKTKEAVRGEDGNWHLSDKVIDLSQGQTDVDRICAKYAMTQIINNISKGKIPQLDGNGNIVKDAEGVIQFEPYDPIDKNHDVEEKLQKVMSAYMIAEKVNVLTKIDTEYKEANNTKYGDTKRDDKAISKVYKQYTTEYAYAVETMEKYQVKLTDTKNFDIQLLSNTKGYTPSATDSSEKTNGGNVGRNIGRD